MTFELSHYQKMQNCKPGILKLKALLLNEVVKTIFYWALLPPSAILFKAKNTSYYLNLFPYADTIASSYVKLGVL